MAKIDETPVNTGKTIALGITAVAIVVIGLIVLFGTFYTVDSGEEAVLLTFGQASPTAIGPGLHMKFPLVQSVVKYDMRTRKFGADAKDSTMEAAASSDLQIVKAQLAVNYHLATGTSPKIYTQLGGGYEQTLISPLVHETMKAVTARFTAADLINKREQVSSEMTMLLREKLSPYNLVIDQVSITQFDFSEQFNTAIEAKVTAEQQKQKAANDLERIKIEAQQVATQGQGQADAALAVATAQAKAIDLINQQLQRSPNYIELQRVQKWNGQYPNFYMAGGNTPGLLMQIPVNITG
jgi:regulator of protease activity HflC (stomatin/prohibitin superfamily)